MTYYLVGANSGKIYDQNKNKEPLYAKLTMRYPTASDGPENKRTMGGASKLEDKMPEPMRIVRESGLVQAQHKETTKELRAKYYAPAYGSRRSDETQDQYLNRLAGKLKNLYADGYSRSECMMEMNLNLTDFTKVRRLANVTFNKAGHVTKALTVNQKEVIIQKAQALADQGLTIPAIAKKLVVSETMLYNLTYAGKLITSNHGVRQAKRFKLEKDKEILIIESANKAKKFLGVGMSRFMNCARKGIEINGYRIVEIK